MFSKRMYTPHRNIQISVLHIIINTYICNEYTHQCTYCIPNLYIYTYKHIHMHSSIHINIHTAYRHIYIHLLCQEKRPITHTKETYRHWHTWGMHKCQKRPVRRQKRPITHTKETYRHWHTWAPSVCHSVNPPGGYQYSPAHTKKKFKKKFFHFSLPVQPCTHQEMKEKKLCLQSGKP